jgi:hypothetical protein
MVGRVLHLEALHDGVDDLGDPVQMRILIDVMMSARAQDRGPLSLFPGTHWIELLDVRAAAACAEKRTWIYATPAAASCRSDSIPQA